MSPYLHELSCVTPANRRSHPSLRFLILEWVHLAASLPAQMRHATMPVPDAGGNGAQSRSRSRIAALPSAPVAMGTPRAVASQGCRLRLSSMGPPEGASGVCSA